MTDLHYDTMTVVHETPAPLRQRAHLLLDRLVHQVAVWHERARGRAELARLSDRQLRDLGISPADRAVELAKPFWRA